MDQVTCDVVIIGGGPAGATAAIYTARAGLHTVVLHKGLRTGALGLAGKIANFPGGCGEPSGAELLARMHQQAEAVGAQLVQDRVLSVDLGSELRMVWTSKGLYQARAVIIATGAMGRTSTLPGEERLLGLGVSYCAICDAAFFRDEVVAVAGNTQEAAEEALLLAQTCQRVHVLVQTPEMQAPAEMAHELAEHPRITLHPATRLLEIVGDGAVEGVRIAARGAEAELLPVKGVFVYVQGRQPITDFLAGQLPTSPQGCLEVDAVMQTIVPGVFAVGDVLCTHIKQAIISAGEGAIAGIAAQRYLSGRATLRPDWSA